MGVEAAANGAGALELVGLRRTFGDVVALDGLSFSVPSGVLFGFVGRNGAGKTTTMRIVCGLLAADEGSVTWRGEAIDARVRQRIG
jgi:ABC-2 type transport system ATP-binding protein